MAACFYADRKEAQALPITLTFHIGPFTVTIRVTRKERKSEDRNEKTTATPNSDGVLRSSDRFINT